MRSATLFPRIRTPRPVVVSTPGEAKKFPCVPSSDSLVTFGAYIGGRKVACDGIAQAVQLVRQHNEDAPKPEAYVWVGLYEPEAPRSSGWPRRSGSTRSPWKTRSRPTSGRRWNVTATRCSSC